MRHLAARQHGVSLIEALVAMAVMAFGMLGVVGVQATLRYNADVSKQRSEAVRLAQQWIENNRSFTAVSTTSGAFTYSDLADVSQAITGYTTNTAYTLVAGVAASGDTPQSDLPRMKTLRVTVNWADRTAASGTTNQSVELNTAIARIMPELGGTLALAGGVTASGLPTRGPNGRNASIPLDAVNFGSGTSGYIPPNRPVGDQTAWLFNNATGLITVCTTVIATNAALNSPTQLSCGSGTAWLLAGTVNFGAAGTVAEAISPSGTAQTVQVGLTQTFPSAVSAPACYTTAVQTGVSFVRYFCAVAVSSSSSPASSWSGYSYVSGASILNPGASLPVASGTLMTCRYTLTRSDAVVPAITNAQHPRAYLNAAASLVAQNFLLVPYVSGSVSDCPDSAAALGGTTTYPQPSTAPPTP
jgi:Tfp pilus assembly protein PilV